MSTHTVSASQDRPVIRSADNPRIKQISKWMNRSKARREDGCFVAEGKKLFLETPASLRREVYVTETFAKEETALLEGVVYEVVEDRLFSKLSDTKTPQGILTVASMPAYSWDETAGEIMLLLEDIRDPGNLGTIFRTAEAAGVSGLILSEGCADPFQPKVIRSTMGSIYRVPFRIEKDLHAAVEHLKAQGARLVSTEPDAATSFRDMPSSAMTVYMLGNEANGLSPEMKAAADLAVRIPMHGKVESLNVAIATAILLFDK